MTRAINKWKARVEAATVRVTAKGGQGVLVPGGFVLTAAHCITWNGDGAMALGDSFPESITTPSGHQFRLEPHAVDPCSDIAALGHLDNQIFPDDCEAFDAWCESTMPVPVSTHVLAIGKSIAVHVLSHQGKWITGKATQYGVPGSLSSGRVWLEANAPIKCGTSGGPILDEAGRLVGLVSETSGNPAGKCEGMIPVVHLALPTWICTKISKA